MTKTLKIGIAGLGTVGCGVINLLADNAKLIEQRSGTLIEVTAVSSRSKGKDRGISLSPDVKWYDNCLDMAADSNVDIVLELIGGSEGIALHLVEAALSAGKDVVTANKALIAHHGAELVKLADANNASLLFEASVAGGVPVIKTLREGLAANEYSRVVGILNGTCNYILTTMEKTGRSFDDVLKEAQELGYAEADPSFDIDGVDTAHKLAICASLAFGVAPDMDSLHIEGIRNVTYQDIQSAYELGYRIKLLGITARNAANGKIEQRVHPCMIALDSPLAKVDDVLGAVQIEGNHIGKVFLEGPGAGAGATASSVVADVIDIARGIRVAPLNVDDVHTDTDGNADSAAASFSPIDEISSSYYLRLSVLDKAGVMANIASILSNGGISLASLIQHQPTNDRNAQIILTTHQTNEKDMQDALDTIAKLDTVTHKPQIIRIEEL